MTDEQVEAHLTAWIKDYCNNQFFIKNPDYDEENPESEEYIEKLPGGVEIFLDRAVSYFKQPSGITSESLGDHSISFDTDIPESLLKLLKPYRKVKWA